MLIIVNHYQQLHINQAIQKLKLQLNKIKL